ncbi:hypothetical protein PaecuDRAFT_2468 [Paenibacillus curdlanolyticus YK9]|uniref:Deacetylase PdaC domain-containing protein n=1 Tax=Paenibacillus curdlanolyticus YK9 TaxID=717606 RepID=E0I9Y1_9BACL|nr:DUF4163 domain-containing protein [Paenibacillus curdlanolyticus]EFM10558.1 hypothetical protein PaecuDRAFT_2468 [Paenibacillus curdlanolyticus YK9]
MSTNGRLGLSVSLLLVIATLLAACTSSSEPTARGEQKQAADQATTQSKEPAMPQLTSKTYADGTITIKYPQLAGMESDARQQAINKLLQDQALAILQAYDVVQDKPTIDVSYTIAWQSPQLLSIEYTGYGNVEGAAHPSNLFYTTNVDLDDAALVRLKEAYEINEAFVQHLKSGAFEVLSPALLTKAEVVEQLAQYTNEEWIEQLKRADSLESIGTEQQSDIYSFFMKEKLGLSLPVAHAAGDHVELALPYTDLSQWKKRDFQ